MFARPYPPDWVPEICVDDGQDLPCRVQDPNLVDPGDQEALLADVLAFAQRCHRNTPGPLPWGLLLHPTIVNQINTWLDDLEDIYSDVGDVDALELRVNAARSILGLVARTELPEPLLEQRDNLTKRLEQADRLRPAVLDLALTETIKFAHACLALTTRRPGRAGG